MLNQHLDTVDNEEIENSVVASERDILQSESGLLEKQDDGVPRVQILHQMSIIDREA